MSNPRLPTLTHLQFLVLGLLRPGELPGRVIRETLGKHGIRRTAPAFYQLMARLERDGLIEGRYEQVTAGGQAVTERRYSLLSRGRNRWDEARDFYAAAGAAGDTRWSDV